MNNRTRWNVAKREAHTVLLFYPDYKREYEERVTEAMTKDPEYKGGVTKPLISDPTSAAALRLATDRRAAYLRQKIEAVETAMQSLTPLELAFCRERYGWDLPKDVQRKTTNYEYLESKIGYEKWTLIRINRKIIKLVAAYLGSL